MSKKNGIADPTRLKPFDPDEKQLLRVIIETPKGSRNKFAFNPDEHIFELKKVLPSGMTFPYDFGFVPLLTLNYADWSATESTSGKCRLIHQHQDIDRIAIICFGRR
jgi:inorganic pyrophosphatase